MPVTWELKPATRARKITRCESELLELEAQIDEIAKEQERLQTEKRALQKRRIQVIKMRDQLKDPSQDWKLEPLPTFDDVN